MRRRGVEHIGVIVGMALFILLFVIMVWLYKEGITTPFTESLTCNPDDPQYYCAPVAEGCGDEGNRAYSKFFGCSDSNIEEKICCIVKRDPSYRNFQGEDGPVVELGIKVYELSLDKDQKVQDEQLVANGKTIAIYGDRSKVFQVSTEIEECDNCIAGNITYMLETQSGTHILDTVAFHSDDRDSSGTTDVRPPKILLEQLPPEEDSTQTTYLRFQFTDSHYGETFKWSLKAQMSYTINESGNERIEVISDDVTLFLLSKPAVRYGGLTQEWSRAKTITALCVDPMKCENIYYMIVADDTSLPEGMQGPPVQFTCPDLSLKEEEICINGWNGEKGCYAPVEITPQHCVMNENQQTLNCYPTNEECVSQGLAQYIHDDYSIAHTALMEGIEEGLIPENVAVFFQQTESSTSSISCQPSLPIDLGEDDRGLYRPFKATQSGETWRFTLDMPYMTGQHLCVYGQDSFDENKFYPAGDPQKIRIDRIAPHGTVDFKPATLRLQFTCDDEHSGCEDYYGISYVSELGSFLRALVNQKNPQSASLWCPGFNTGRNYAPETRQQTVYPYNELRVLCLRVVDRAGNSAVSMTTVYNAYNMLAAALAKYRDEQFEKEQEERDRRIREARS